MEKKDKGPGSSWHPFRESKRKPTGRQAFVYFVRILYCAEVRGTTESRPCRTSGESSNSESAFICPRETGCFIGGPALIVMMGFLGSSLFTDTTVAVPTALLMSPVS